MDTMPRSYNLAVLPGDGIGPEVMREALHVVNALGEVVGYSCSITEAHIGGAALDVHDDPFPQETQNVCLSADAVLLGAVGGPAWDHHVGDKRPESGLLALRKLLGTYANLRPVAVPESLAASSPLRSDIVSGTDLLIVRELTGGIYFGEPKARKNEGNGEVAYNTMVYSTEEIQRITRIAMDWARRRKNKLTLVDKANVLVASQLWRDVVRELHAKEYSDVELDMLYVDNAAMQIVLAPSQFDVIVTSNLFGDILSDLAATLPGSLGMLPSASLGGGIGLFEPVHGSAPDIAGQGKANPLAMMLSTAMMLDTLGEESAAGAIRGAVQHALDNGNRTGDMWSEGYTLCSTEEIGQLITQYALEHVSALTT